MFFQKKNDGTAPIKYKQGIVKRNRYQSKCLGYAVKIPEGCEVVDAEKLEQDSTPNDICDFFGILASGVRIGVHYRPGDGSIEIPDDKMRDMLGSTIVQRANQQHRGELESTYYGLVNFCGKPCCHSIMYHKKDGTEWISELYEYYSTYYVFNVTFTYLPDGMGNVEEAKALFSSLS